MINAQHGITSLKDLHDHLQYAIGLELTTIPAYLCALYSIRPGANSAAREALQSVVLEEMLHMALAANVLNAIGGTPSTGKVGRGASPVPVYPAQVHYLDNDPFPKKIHLQAFSRVTLEGFIAIESPRPDSPHRGKKYASIGDFYTAIEVGLKDKKICPPELFKSEHHKRGDRQVSSADYYGGAGMLIEVKDRHTALKALSEIVREGEGLRPKALDQTASEQKRHGIQTLRRLAGLSPLPVVDADKLRHGWKMYSHYARFMEIQYGRHYCPDQKVGEPPRGDILPIDWHAVRPMITDPTAHKYRGTRAYEPMMACNQTYTKLVDTTYRGFNGKPERLRDAVGLMYELKHQAEALFNTPSPLRDEAEAGRTLGPAFEYLHDQTNPSH